MNVDSTVKVILLTASGNLNTINECVQAGAASYALKPFKFEELLGLISTTLCS